jgi:uncharacterized protein YndB with AHSA1/START domain
MAREKTRAVSQVYYIKTSPKKVFAAISEPRRLVRWMAQAATLSPRKRGAYSFTWQAGYHHEGKVLEFVRGKQLTLAWPYHDGDRLLGETKLRLSVKAKGKGTEVSLRQSGFPVTPEWLDIYLMSGAGWAYYMMNLKSVLEHGHDLRSKRDWMER